MTLEIHDYWQRLRSGRPVADRAQIDPVDIKRVLPHLLLLDGGGEPPRFRYRLVGTAIRESRLGLEVLDQTGYYERIVLPLTHGGDELRLLLVTFVKANLPPTPVVLG